MKRPDQNDFELLQLLLYLKRTSPLHYYYYRVLIAYKSKRCPIYLDRPAIRFMALYTALIVLLSLVAQAQTFMEYLLTCAGGALAWSVTLSGIADTWRRIRGG